MNSELLIPNTGELIDLANLAPDELGELILNLREVERELFRTRRRVERELIDRMRERQLSTLPTASGYTVHVHSGHSRVWDPDDLETAVRQLVDDGVINAGQWTGLIRHEIKVDGNRARDLLNSLTGTARQTVEACYRWKDTEPTVTVKPPRPPAIEATAEEDE